MPNTFELWMRRAPRQGRRWPRRRVPWRTTRQNTRRTPWWRSRSWSCWRRCRIRAMMKLIVFTNRIWKWNLDQHFEKYYTFIILPQTANTNSEGKVTFHGWSPRAWRQWRLLLGQIPSISSEEKRFTINFTINWFCKTVFFIVRNVKDGKVNRRAKSLKRTYLIWSYRLLQQMH